MMYRDMYSIVAPVSGYVKCFVRKCNVAALASVEQNMVINEADNITKNKSEGLKFCVE